MSKMTKHASKSVELHSSGCKIFKPGSKFYCVFEQIEPVLGPRLAPRANTSCAGLRAKAFRGLEMTREALGSAS